MDHCSLCENPFDNQPQMELLCHHRYHTQCFLDNVGVAILGGAMLQCVQCHQPLFPGLGEQEDEEEEEQDDAESVASNTSEQQQTRIVNLWHTNEQFRKDIKAYQASTRGINKPKTDFMKLVRTKKQEVTPRFSLLKAQYQGLAGVKKDEILQSQEYKAYKAAYAKQARYGNKLRNHYNMTFYDFRYLRQIRGLKSLHRPSYWRTRPEYVIRRALRLRLTY